MTDVVDAATRSRMMSGIRGVDTKPEWLVRRGLHRQGLRYRLHDRTMPGRPDLVFPKHGVVLFVHGCFWHGHDCHLFKWPSTRRGFWKEKIGRTQERDLDNLTALDAAGWRVLRIWECALKGRGKLPLDTVIQSADRWLKSSEPFAEIRGTTSTAAQEPNGDEEPLP